MAPMLVACPSFAPAWSAFVAEWRDEPALSEDGGDGSLPLYLALADLARHLVQKLETGDTQAFAAVFAVVEQWIECGDPYVSEAAIVGLLEDLQNGNFRTRTQPADFEAWLGPRSRRWWAEVGDFWDRLAAGNFRPLSID